MGIDHDPVRYRNEPSGEQSDVETVFIDPVLFFREQVEQQGSQMVVLEDLGNIVVSRAFTAAAAPVRKQDNATGLFGH